jgi:hypothetical protein
MVYSQICGWVDDYLQAEPPEELLDNWDFQQWISETGVTTLFEEYIQPSYTTKRARNDATQILMTLLWEYYLYRRLGVPFKPAGTALQGITFDATEVVFAGEFPSLFDDRRNRLLRRKVTRGLDLDDEKVYVGVGEMSAANLKHRNAPVLRALYTRLTGLELRMGEACRHGTLDRLAAGGTWIASDGRLVLFSAPVQRRIENDIVPDEYYQQIQILMEIYNVECADFYECRLYEGDTGGGSRPHGVVAVVGDIDNPETWSYSYSDVFDESGVADAWQPEGNVIEKKVWFIETSQHVRFHRNRRWWNMVGLPEYKQFVRDIVSARTDPMFFMPTDPVCMIDDML